MANFRAIVAHGRTDIDSNSMFKCPSNIRCILFERPGLLFQKVEAALLLNTMISFVKDSHKLSTMDNKLIHIPIVGGKQYISRIYCENNKVPNINFHMQDDDIQCGLFRFEKKGSSLKVKITPKNSTFNPSVRPYKQVDIHIDPKMLSDETDIKGVLSEETKLFTFKNPDRKLSDILTDVSLHTPPDTIVNVFVFTCREYYSEAVNNLIVQRIQDRKNTIEEYQALQSFLTLGTAVTEQFTNKALNLASTITDLRNINNQYLKYFNTPHTNEDMRGLKRTDLYKNPPGLIKALYGVPGDNTKGFALALPQPHRNMTTAMFTQMNNNKLPDFIPQIDCTNVVV